ncbi:2,3-bisphosphoglycerate-dependent phosphoglycerate mutase [Labrenzia sp. THAF82]|uniref:SixA phosphatase family protein n=1 Tax=Labrenzia sp. THAF82 TaxID=2587861 RepID=UPI0012697180|nr:histidine phosphatase family protein [Labrenzia sp. THAF82]QFT31250.1 2,3-bisphosphoglycerate-dependent phosphoglycerate mutase [Labrenzia sp. THAF82]
MRLLLLRHAKSDWGDDDLEDIDRPLNSRGKTAAMKMGRYLQQNGLLPNQIMCSTSQRTRETLSRVLQFLPQEAQIHLISDLYRQSEDDYTPLIRKYGGRAQNLMVIGHNPATEDTALSLTGTAAPEALADLEEKYPTAALSVLDFDIADWSELGPKTGHLERFVKPRDLKDEPD